MKNVRRESKTLFLCAGLILFFSYIFTYFAFTDPEVMKRFNYVMFIPTPVARKT